MLARHTVLNTKESEQALLALQVLLAYTLGKTSVLLVMQVQ